MHGVLPLAACALALHHDVADIAALRDHGTVEGRGLTLLPGDDIGAGSHPALLAQQAEGPGLFADHDHPLERRHAGRQAADVEVGAAAAVVAAVGVLAVGPHAFVVGNLHLAAGVAAGKALETLDPHRQALERPAGQLADDSQSEELLPPGFGLAVVHDEVGMAQLAGGAEIENPRAEPAVEHDRGIAQRAIGDRNRHSADGIVDDFVPHQDAQRVGPGVLADDDRDDRLAPRQALHGGLADRGEFRLVDGGDAVLRRTARADRRKIDPRVRKVGLRPFRFPRARRIGDGALINRNEGADEDDNRAEQDRPAAGAKADHGKFSIRRNVRLRGAGTRSISIFRRRPGNPPFVTAR